MTPPNNASFWLQLFMAGFSVFSASSLALTAVYFARLDHALGAIVVVVVFFCMVGFVVATGSLAILLIIGANRLRRIFGKQPIAS